MESHNIHKKCVKSREAYVDIIQNFFGVLQKMLQKKKNSLFPFSRKCVFFVTFFAEAQNFFGWHLQMLQKI